jgi:hypothetical protein
MGKSRMMTALVAAAGIQCLPSFEAAAQLGLYTLPKSDFVWNWGELNLERRFGSADIEISGGESFFRCDLTARMRPASPLSTTEIREIESELRTRLDFIYAVSQYMNSLEYQRALDWATLDCKKYDPEPASPEQRAERENEAREKMLRELERRRARQQRNND